MNRAKRSFVCALSAAALSIPAAALKAQPRRDFSDVEIEIISVQKNVYALIGPGGNTTVQVGPDGVLVVDTQFAGVADKLLAAIRTLSDGPIRYVVNTHVHRDHTDGNAALIAAGSTISGGNVSRAIEDSGVGAKALAHENVLARMVEEGSASDAWPTDVYVEGPKELFFNGEAVRIIHQPAAHTDGDSIVHFRGSDVVATGDIFTTTGYPFIDRERGGNIQGIIAALNAIIDITVPRAKQEGGTMVVPGHGRICDEADVVEYRDMLTIIRDRVQYMIAQGKSLEDVQQARPTFDYDPRYAPGDAEAAERFVAAVYRSLVEEAGRDVAVKRTGGGR